LYMTIIAKEDTEVMVRQAHHDWSSFYRSP
jgi:hypothetical protein